MPIANNLMAPRLSPVPFQPRPMPYIKEDRPAYMVREGKAYIGNTFFDEGELLYYDLEPSLQMQPLNGMAADAYEHMLKKLDDLGEKRKKQSNTYNNGQPYIYMAELPRRKHLIELARDKNRRDELVYSIMYKKSVPIFSQTTQRDVQVVERIGGQEQAWQQPGPTAGAPEMKKIV